jgi:hypothetical protein
MFSGLYHIEGKAVASVGMANLPDALLAQRSLHSPSKPCI